MNDIADLKLKLDENGYIIIENVLAEKIRFKLIQHLNDIYNDLEKKGINKYPGGIGETEKLILNLQKKHRLFINLIDHPSILPFVKYMLQNGSYQNEEPFILSQFAARDPHYGAPEQQMHIDSRFPGAPYALSVIVLWILNDFTIESGATRIVPGSHLRKSYPENGVAYPDEVRVIAPAGSVMIYNASLWHGGGAKLKDIERWSIIASYSRWFIKPSFDMTQDFPNDIYENLSPLRKELFGFTTIPPVDENVRVKRRISIEDLGMK